MHEASRSDIRDGVRWRCRQCKTSRSIRDESFFSKSRISLQKWLLLMYLWARNYPARDVAQEAEIDKNTACDILQWFREVCSAKLIKTGITLGGPGKVVQTDESLFRHKPKVKSITLDMIITIYFTERCLGLNSCRHYIQILELRLGSVNHSITLSLIESPR